MKSCVLSSYFEPFHIYHGVLQTQPSMIFLHAKLVHITREFFDLLSRYTYDGEGKVAWPVFVHDFLAMLDEDDGCSNKHNSMLLAYTLHESPLQWSCSLPTDNVHSLEHFCDLIEDIFHHFDPKHVDHKLLQQQKAPHESPDDFWQCFRVF